MTWLGTTFKVGSTAITYGSVLMILLFVRVVVRAAPDGVGPARLRGRRQPRGGAPDRHPHRPRAADASTCVAGADLRHRRAAADRAARTWATRTPARPTTSTRSPPSCSAARACSAAAARVIGTLIGALIVGVIRNGLSADGRRLDLPGPDHRHPGHRRGGRRPDRAEERRDEPDADPQTPVLSGARPDQALRPGRPRSTARTSTSTRRDPRRHRRQRRRQVEPDQGAVRRR